MLNLLYYCVNWSIYAFFQKNFYLFISKIKLKKLGRWFNIDILDLFFVVLLFNCYIIFSFFYELIESFLFSKNQGEKLKLKEILFNKNNK